MQAAGGMDSGKHRASETMRAVWCMYLASESACMHRASETMRAEWYLCTALHTGEHACLHRASTSMTAVCCLYIPCQGHAGRLQLGLASGLASHEASECMHAAQGDGCRPCQGHAGRLQLGLPSGLASH